FEHAGQDLATQLDGGNEVEAVEKVDVAGGHIDEEPGTVDPRVVDEDVDRAAVGLHTVDQARELLGIGEVGGMCGAAQTVGQLLEGALGAGDKSYSRPGSRETLGEGLADAAGGACDQDPLARELHRREG